MTDPILTSLIKPAPDRRPKAHPPPRSRLRRWMEDNFDDMLAAQLARQLDWTRAARVFHEAGLTGPTTYSAAYVRTVWQRVRRARGEKKPERSATAPPPVARVLPPPIVATPVPPPAPPPKPASADGPDPVARLREQINRHKGL